jgi:hypothetical protein
MILIDDVYVITLQLAQKFPRSVASSARMGINETSVQVGTLRRILVTIRFSLKFSKLPRDERIGFPIWNRENLYFLRGRSMRE